MSGEDFLSRWSRLKKTARQPEADRPVSPAPEAPQPVPAASAAPAAAPASAEPEPLPPVESLTPESDFAPFMRTGVAPALRRQALRALFQDPRFNVMDGLDVYIDDYSKPDPIPPEWLGQLRQMARLGDYQEPKEVAEANAEASDARPEPETPATGADASGAAAPEAQDPASEATRDDAPEAGAPASR